MRIVEQIEVKAPIVECYKLGIAYDRYHEILKNIKSIKPKGSPDVWHWEVEGPNGQTLTWDVELRGEKHNNQVISWHTIRQGDIAHSGALTFSPINDHTTQVRLVVEYTSSSSAGFDVKGSLEQYGQQIAKSSLQAFKQLAEAHRGAALPTS